MIYATLSSKSHNNLICLDVYKRQAINAPLTGTCVVRRKPPSVAPANTITLENKIMYPISVSYTHLDVYKRQFQNLII